MKHIDKTSKLFLIVLFCGMVHLAQAHFVNYSNQPLKHWKLNNGKTELIGSFSMYKNGSVYIEDANFAIAFYPLQSFSKADQDFVLNKYAQVERLNHDSAMVQPIQNITSLAPAIKLLLLFGVFIALALIVFLHAGKKQVNYLATVLAAGVLFGIYSFHTSAINSCS